MNDEIDIKRLMVLVLAFVGVLAIAVYLIGGFGGSGESSPTRTVEKFIEQVYDGNVDGACEYLTVEARSLYRGMIEAAVYTIQASGLEMDYEISSEIVEGDKATVKVDFLTGPPPPDRDTYKLVLEDGKWLINEIID